MKIYLKNKTTGEISDQEAKSFFSLSKNIRDLNDEATQGEGDAFALQEAKDSKIAQIKANRKEANQNPLISIQAYEAIDNNNGSFTTTTDLVYFAFRTEGSGDELTSPSNLLNACLRGNVIRYSCEILNPSRKGYVEITQAAAENIESHLINRGQNNVYYANDLEAQVNDCLTIAEVNNIDINFS